MIPVEEAIRIVLENTQVLPQEEVDFREAPNRVLAEDVACDMDLPPFPRSAVDGFALRADDLVSLPQRLRVVGVVPAGVFPSFEIGPGDAAQIMTGAPVPSGADAVQMVEHTRSADGQVEILENVAAGQHVVPRGQEVKVGDIVLRKGMRLDPASVAVAATAGKTRLRVGSRPDVTILATGDELVEPDTRPSPGQIRNSNGFALAAQAQAMGARVEYLGVARDTEASLRDLIGRGLGHHALLISGGVSMGRFDLVEKVLADQRVRILFESVALKPGKPLVAGVAPDGGLVFGLPGNPVSTMVTFELVVRPCLAKMEGCQQPERPLLSATLKEPLSSRGARRAFLPGWIEPEQTGLAAYPIATRGSADIVAFAKANSLLIVPEDTDRLVAGETVGVYPLDRFLFTESRWHAAYPS